MEAVVEILKITIPSVVVMLTAYLLIKKLMENETEKRDSELKRKLSDTILPIRMQAYERLVLYLERISPSSLIMRVHKPGMSANRMHAELLRHIREEFEHNLTQQVYVSANAWEMSKNGKEEIIKLVNIAAQNVDKANVDGIALSKAIFELEGRIERMPTTQAIEYLKKEMAKKLF